MACVYLQESCQGERGCCFFFKVLNYLKEKFLISVDDFCCQLTLFFI